jgi:hypothetical protein
MGKKISKSSKSRAPCHCCGIMWKKFESLLTPIYLHKYMAFEIKIKKNQQSI